MAQALKVVYPGSVAIPVDACNIPPSPPPSTCPVCPMAPPAPKAYDADDMSVGTDLTCLTGKQVCSPIRAHEQSMYRGPHAWQVIGSSYACSNIEDTLRHPHKDNQVAFQFCKHLVGVYICIYVAPYVVDIVAAIKLQVKMWSNWTT